MRSNVWKGIANWKMEQLYRRTKVCTPCLDDQFKEEALENSGRICQKFCSQIVLTCLFLARIGGLDIL